MDRTDNIELMRLRVKVIDADRMAAIIDEMVRGRHLDARSKLSDARLDYGQPFNPAGMREGAPMLASTALNADYWLKAGRDTADRDEAVLAVEQSANAWRNAAYALAEKLSRTPVPEAVTIDPGTEKILRTLLDRAYAMMAMSGYRVAEVNADHNNPIIAWMSDAAAVLYGSGRRPDPVADLQGTPRSPLAMSRKEEQ